MWLVAGLGNPGGKYTITWHNCGFMALEILSQRNQISVKKDKFKGKWGQGFIGTEKVIFLRPYTYMNASGESIIECMQFFKIPSERVLVLYDDIDISKGTIRYRATGSAGTHNGMRSVVSILGTENIPRIRIGCGPVPDRWDLVDYVLAEIPKQDREVMYDAFVATAQKAEEIICEAGE